MIEVKHYGSGERVRTYECTPKREIELCLANIECLLNIALLDSDEHIKELGGERELLVLMNGYLDLAYRLNGIMASPTGQKGANDMASRYIKNGNKTKDFLVMRRQTEWLVPHIYAAIACELWDKGWTSEQIQELFTASQERWFDSQRNGWDILENVAEVTGIDVRYFKKTGNIV